MILKAETFLPKKILSFLCIFSFFFALKLSANPLEQVHEYTLENGMQVFLLEDFSDALVHIEFTCHAGFSSQTPQTCGFFKLFSRIIKASTPELQFSDVQCNADSTRYKLNISPSKLDKTLSALSDAVFAPDYTEEVMNAELKKLKDEVSENAETMSFYLNAAIDSRVFSDAPWKNDSGIYPPLFKKTTAKTARSILKTIADNWYIPKNSAVFISGNLNSEKTLVLLKNTFGRFYSSYSTPGERPSIPVNHQRKYVFHSPEISADLTQIVMQYTMLNVEQCDLLSVTLNNNNSAFKATALDNEKLNIPGAEYIDISSAHKRNSSRLIIQTLLMHTPEVRAKEKTKLSSFEQAQAFIDLAQKLPDFLSDAEFQYAKNKAVFDMNYLTANPVMFMDSLSSFWATQPYQNFEENDFLSCPASVTASLFMSRNSHLQKETLSPIFKILNAESPFIFVIINSKDYKANKKLYQQAGFEEINETNSSWYVQTMFKEIKEQLKPEPEPNYQITRISETDNNYYDKNLSQLATTKLSNGITVVTKQNKLSDNICLLLSIKGGAFYSSDNPGFEEVMINLMAGIIQKHINQKKAEGLILGMPSVTSKTQLATGAILIEFEKADLIAVCEAIATSIIYGEVAPADADHTVSSRQYKKRLENGSSTSQMNSELIKNLYGKGRLSALFDTEKDILQATDYKSILASYPKLLDAERYTAIVTGNFEDDIFVLLEKTLGMLNQNKTAINYSAEKASFPKNKTLSVKIRHTFLTDIPAEKAGPQPAKLIPTKEFLDPVIFAFEAPEAGTKQASLFNALMCYVCQEMQKAVNLNKRFSDSTVSVQLPRNSMQFATLTVQNVQHTKEVDAVFKNVIQNINSKLSQTQSCAVTVQQIKDAWILSEMSQTQTNSGTAWLMQKGLELLNPEDEAQAAFFYLKEYDFVQNANAEDFMKLLEFLPQKAPLRVYSADGKN